MTTGETLAERYRFADFTREAYRDLLRIAKRTYTFRSYPDFRRDERFVLWRHDVDFSVHSARALARIEAEEGCPSTYFVLPHSEYYNLLERDVTNAIREILDMGHQLGLHFDSHFHGVEDDRSLEKNVAGEARLLESVFGRRVEVFSFHNTTPFTMSCRKWTYGGLINTYAEYFQQEVGYCSDSNGYWRHQRLQDVLAGATDERLQILTHDAWWQDSPMPPRAKLFRSVLGRAASTIAQYDRAFPSGGVRQNVCEIADVLAPLAAIDPSYVAAVEPLWFQALGATLLIELWRRYDAGGHRPPEGFDPAEWGRARAVRDALAHGDRSVDDASLLAEIGYAVRALVAAYSIPRVQ